MFIHSLELGAFSAFKLGLNRFYFAHRSQHEGHWFKSQPVTLRGELVHHLFCISPRTLAIDHMLASGVAMLLCFRATCTQQVQRPCRDSRLLLRLVRSFAAFPPFISCCFTDACTTPGACDGLLRGQATARGLGAAWRRSHKSRCIFRSLLAAPRRGARAEVKFHSA